MVKLIYNHSGGLFMAKKNVSKKTVAYVISHCSKNEKIQLQNILFGTTEKKLMVSNEFLNSMTIKYVSKRMKLINTYYENVHLTRSPSKFFRYSEELEKMLDELITIESYYTFKNPSPSIFKKSYLELKQELITKMLNRAWRSIIQKHPIKNIEEIDEKVMISYDMVINEMLSYKEFLSEDDLTLVNNFYIQVHGEEVIEEEFESDDESSENIIDDNLSELSDDELLI